MTPAVEAALAGGVEVGIHRYEHDPAHGSYGLEAAELLGVDPGEVFKTLVVNGQSGLGLAVVPVEATVDLKAVAATLAVKRVTMAEPGHAERATGYVVGGISPLGTRQRLPTVIDETAWASERIYCSGGRRGLDISLSPDELVLLTQGSVASIARWS